MHPDGAGPRRPPRQRHGACAAPLAETLAATGRFWTSSAAWATASSSRAPTTSSAAWATASS
eukprot:3342594-Alexandrium_andersonii.AAC.1